MLSVAEFRVPGIRRPQGPLSRRGFAAFCAGLLLLGLLLGAAPQAAQAQGTLRASVLNVPPVLSSPYVSDLEQNVRQGRYAVQLTYSNATGDRIRARLRLTVRHEGEQVLQTTSQLAVFQPGTYTYRTFEELPELVFEESAGDLIDQLRARLGDEIVRSGVLPEGEYTIEAKPLLADPAAPVSPVAGTAVTTVRYPEPPRPISPADQARITVEQPVFSWTPVNGTAGDRFEYELLIAEVLPGQTPLQAIEANRLVTGQGPITLRQRTSFSYTQELPPLEAGATYAWQVRARETTQGVPLSDDGESEIYTFTYGSSDEQKKLSEVSEIPLVPDFARLTQLDRLEVRKEGKAYVLNGKATLALSFADQSEPVRATVEAQNLRVQASDPTILLGGQVRGAAPETTPGDSLRLLSPETIRWRMDEGVTLQARVRRPNGSPVGRGGTISLTPAGPRGTLTATGNPLTRFSARPIIVRVTKLRARFPQQTLRATGTVRAFGKRTECTVDPLRLGPGAGTAFLDCAMRARIPLSSDTSAAMRVEIRRLEGTLGARWGRDSLDYDLMAQAAVEVQMANTEACGVRATLSLTPGSGAELQDSAANCPVPMPRIDLGLADLLIDRLGVETLRYRPQDGWAAALSADAAVHLGAFGNAALPEMTDLRITPDGVTVPSVSYTASDLAHLEPFTVEGVQMELQGFSGPSTSLPWPSGSDPTASPWGFSVDLSLRFPNFAQGVPSCLSAASISIEDAGVKDGTFSASIPAKTLEDCRVPLGSGEAELALTRLGGQIDVTTDGGSARLDPTLTLGARLTTAPPVACKSSADATVDLGSDALTIDTAKGLLAGTVGNVPLNCRLSIGPLSAQMSDLTLELTSSNGQQDLFLAGTATVGIDQETKASGPFRLNLRTGQFTKLDIQITDPFKLRIPRQNPALVFRVQRARLTPNGLTVDGRNELILPQTTIGATFDQVRFGLASRQIETGAILLDRAFGFAAQVDPSTQALTLKAVGSASGLTASPGLYFGLSGTPRIDSTGLSLKGPKAAAKAVMDVPALTQKTGLKAVPSDSFAVGLDPFGIRQGRVTFRRASGETALAYADRDGLHLSPFLATGALPAKLPLPSKQVAYLRLKDPQGNLLVQANRQPSGKVQLSTKPGQPLQLYVPALQGPQSRVPRLDVSLNQLTIDGANGTYVSGTVTASVPQGHALRDLTGQGVPLALREIRFGTEQVAGARRQALFLEGDLSLMGTALKPGSAQHRATFYVESGQTAQAQIQLRNLGATVPVAGAGKAQLDVASVTGSATVPLGGGSRSPTFRFQVNGAFALETAGGSRIAASDVRITYERSTGAGSARLTVGSVQSRSLANPDSIDTGSYLIAVPSVNGLSLSYDPSQKALSFSANLDVTLGFDLSNGPTVAFPLQHVTISDQGFSIPKQSINPSSVSGLSFSRIPLGPVEIKPIALRTTVQAQYDWFGGGSFSLTPKLDLAVYLPSFYGTNPGPSQGVTLSNVRFTNGTLKGTASYNPTPAARLPLGPPSSQPPGLKVSKITATLQDDPTGSGQDVDVDLRASLVSGSGPLTVAKPGQCQSPTTFTVSVVQGPGVKGTAQNTDPCGTLQWGPVTLELTNAALDFSFTNGTQRLVATGDVTATLPNATANQPPITVQGTNVGVDLIDGQITSGAVTVNTPIRVPVPLAASDPFLTFQAGTSGGARPVATLDANGLTIGQVSGSLDLNQGSVGVSFNNLRFDLDPQTNFPITQGTATINANVAVQTGLNPINWTLVDPSTSFDATTAGARLTLDSKATLSKDGLTFTGGGQAQATVAGQQLTSLRLGFQNSFTIGTQPVAVTQGRANLYRQQSNSPVVWFDANGVHTTLGAITQTVVPDTLGLPTKDVAYLVLKKNPNGPLLVNTSSTSSGGTRIETKPGTPVELVLASLSTSPAPSAQVGFNTTIDSGGNVNVDSLGLSLSNLSIGPDYPFTLTKAFYESGETTPFGVEATVDLPDLMQNQLAQPLTVALQVGKNGFKGQAKAGTYAETHSQSLEQQSPIAEIQEPNASDPTVTVKVRGIDFSFGANTSKHSYKISGDFQTPLLKSQGSSGTEPVLIHYSGKYATSSDSWSFTGTANHIQGKLPMGVGSFDPNSNNGIVVSASNTAFSLKLNGVFAAEGLLKNFKVTVKDLKVGLERRNQQTQVLASVGSIGSSQTQTQTVRLFGDIVDLTIDNNNSSVSIQQNPLVLKVTASGDLTFLRPDKTVSFSNLTVESDGTFSAGNVQVNDLTIVKNHLTLKTLAFEQPSGTDRVKVTADVKATLPKPMGNTTTATIEVERTSSGNVTTSVSNLNFKLDNGKHQIGNNKPTEVGLGNFATFDLTGVGVDLNLSQSNRTPSVYATASMYLKNNTSKRIDFGNASNIQQKPGLEVGMKRPGSGSQFTLDLAYNATTQVPPNKPLFAFETGSFFRLSLTKIGVSGGTNDPLVVTLGGSAGISFPGVVGSVSYKGFEVDKNGVRDEGRINGGGSFGLLPKNPGTKSPNPVVSLEVGAYEAKRNTQSLPVSIQKYTGTVSADKKPKSKNLKNEAPTATRFLRFYNKSGAKKDAINLSLNIGQKVSAGGVEEVLFYRTKSGGTVARVKEASLTLKGTSVTASIEYAKVDGAFTLNVAGTGTLGGKPLKNVGSSKTAIVVGAFGLNSMKSSGKKKMSVGLFAAVEGLGIPIIPGVIELDGLGAGFFLRASGQSDVDKRVNLSGKKIITEKRDEIRNQNKEVLTIKVYGSVGMLGSQGSYVMGGQVMITATTSYSMVEVKVAPSVPKPKGASALSLIPIAKFEQSAILEVDYKGTPSVSGAAYALLRPTPVVTLTLRVGFYAEGKKRWALYSAGTKQSNVQKKPGVDIELLGLLSLAQGKFVLCPDGFYAGLGQDVTLPPSGVNFPVRLRGGFDLEAWAVPGRTMGAYAEAKIKIDVNIKTFGVTGKGAYLVQGGDHLLYGYGSVKIAGGRVHGHVAVYNNNFTAGKGKNGKYEDMIDDARQQAQAMATKADEAAKKVQKMKNTASIPSPSAFATSVSGQRQAGVNLHSEDATGRGIWAFSMGVTEIQGTASKPWTTVKDVITASRPDSSSAHQARQQMAQELNRLQKIAPPVESRLRNANAKLAKIKAKHQQRAASLSSPVQNVQVTPTRDSKGNVTGTPSFSVNSGQASSNEQSLQKVQQDPKELDRRYREALAAALSDLRMFDRATSGSSVINYKVLAEEFELVQTDNAPSFNQSSGAPAIPTGGGGPNVSTSRSTAQTMPTTYSASGVAQQYKKAVTAVDEHYAKRLSYYRELRASYRESCNKLHQKLGKKGGKIKSQLQSIPGITINASMSKPDFQKVEDVIAERYEFIEHLRTGSAKKGNTKKSEFKKQLDFNGGLKSDCTNFPKSCPDSLSHHWRQSGMTLWWHMHDLGLEELVESLTGQVRDVASTYRNKKQDLDSAHEEYTRVVDRLYSLKADLATLTYGMAKEYSRWRRHANIDTVYTAGPADSLATDVSQTLNRLVVSLEPPKIQSISASSQHNEYYTRTTLSWQAVPRSNGGSIREMSVDVSERQSSASASIGQMTFKTVGKDQTMTFDHYAVQTDYQRTGFNTGPYPVEKTKHYSVGVRARGSGGNTAARVGSFNAPIHPNSSTSSPSGAVMDKDQTPPDVPKVVPVKAGERAEIGTGAVYLRRDRYQRPQSYWATDTSTVRLVVLSSDRQSDVTKIEYAAGSQPGQTDRHSWTQVPGVRVPKGFTRQANQSGTNWKQRITIRDLDLSKNTPVYISLRTTNGAGLTSAVGAVNEPFYHDPSPPTVQNVTVRTERYQQDPSSLSFASGYGQKQTASTQQSPGWASSSLVNRAGALDNVEMSVTVKAQDSESGFTGNSILLLDQEVDPQNAFERSTACPNPSCTSPGTNEFESRIDWSLTGTSFADTLYAYVRSTNTSRKSTITEIPVSPNDGTRPTTPTVRVRPKKQGATLYLTQRSSDDESGVDGYQYAVGTTPYGTDVRGWPSSGTDFSHRPIPVPILRNYGAPPKSISIPSSALPPSGNYYVTVRAVNGEGDVSETVTSGPAAYDTSPPPAPMLTTSYAAPVLTVEAQDMGDPESGLGQPPNGNSKNTVWWQVRPLLDTTRVLREGAFHASNLGTGTFNDGKRMTLSRSNAATIDAYGYQAVLTLENGAGMTRTVTTTHVVDPVSNWTSTAKQRWKRGAGALIQDGISATRIAQAVSALDGYTPTKRATLLKNLDQAPSASQRKQVLRTIKQGAP